MNKISDFKECKRKGTLKKNFPSLLYAMNLSSGLLQPHSSYTDDFVKLLLNYIKNPKCINEYDVLLLLQGLYANKALPNETKKIIKHVLQTRVIKQILINDIVKRKALVNAGIKHHEKKFQFWKESLEYFKVILECPEKLTSYDIYMFVIALRDSSEIDKKFFKHITNVIYRNGVNPKDESVYSQSLLSEFIKQPRFK